MATQNDGGDDDDRERRYWFRRRRASGYGPGLFSLPASWEGWLAYAVHLSVVALAAVLLPPGLAIAVLVLATVALVGVAARFGEPPATSPLRSGE